MNWHFFKNLFCPQKLVVSFFGRTDTGKVRAINEDNFSILPQHKVMIVADGMGGHNAGEVASQKAIEKMISILEQRILQKAGENQEEIRHHLISALQQTNNFVIDLAKNSAELSGMGCTFVIAYIHGKILYTCHVGDVRAYLINAEGMRQITTDHTYAAEYEKKVVDGEGLDGTVQMPARNVVSQAIGFPFSRDPECHIEPIHQGDWILLCSDGLWSMLADDEMATIIKHASDPETACDKLIEAANKAGGRDNITAALVAVDAN